MTREEVEIELKEILNGIKNKEKKDFLKQLKAINKETDKLDKTFKNILDNIKFIFTINIDKKILNLIYDIAENISTTSPAETKKYPAEVGPYLSTHKEYFFATVPNSNKADVLSDAYNDGDQTIGDGANCLVLYIDAT